MSYNERFKEIIDSIRDFSKIPHHLKSINDSIQNQTETVHKANESDKEQKKIRQEWFDKVFAEYEQAKRDKAAKKNPEYRVQNGLRWAAWCTFIAAAIYGLITLFLWLNSTEQLELDQRGWLVLDTGYSDNMELGADNTDISMPVKLVNLGKTPIRKIQGFVVLEEIAKGEHPTFNKHSGARSLEIGIMYPGPNFASTTVIQELQSENKTVSVTSIKREKFKKGDIIFNVWGQFLYIDIFKQEHWVHFCHAVTEVPGKNERMH